MMNLLPRYSFFDCRSVRDFSHSLALFFRTRQYPLRYVTITSTFRHLCSGGGYLTRGRDMTGLLGLNNAKIFCGFQKKYCGLGLVEKIAVSHLLLRLSIILFSLLNSHLPHRFQHVGRGLRWCHWHRSGYVLLLRCRMPERRVELTMYKVPPTLALPTTKAPMSKSVSQAGEEKKHKQ